MFLTIIVRIVQLVGILFFVSYCLFAYFAICAVSTASSHGSYLQGWIEFNLQDYPIIGGVAALCTLFTVIHLWIILGKQNKEVKKLANS